MQKTIGILGVLVLVTLLVIVPILDHASAIQTKQTKKITTNAKHNSKMTIAQKNLKTESRHKNLMPRH